MAESAEGERAHALERFRRQLLDFQHLPPAPEIVTEVIALAGDAEASTKRLAELVGRDPALSARRPQTIAARHPLRATWVGFQGRRVAAMRWR